MGSLISRQIQRTKDVSYEENILQHLYETCGAEFPGSHFRPTDHKNWMSNLDPTRLPLFKIVWPGTHDSATDRIGLPSISRPFAQCQTLGIYAQLVAGTRVLDIRVNEDCRVCHGILSSYSMDVVLDDVKKFLSETKHEIIVLEVRTEFGHKDPPDFDKYLTDRLGEYLVPQDEGVFSKTIADLAPKRVICVWKPREAAEPQPGSLLWSAGYLRDNWIDTDLPLTKFNSNMEYLSQQPEIGDRKYLYRVENTVTPQADNLIVCVKPVTDRIHKHARLFISQCFAKGNGDRLQVLSTDFIDADLVDACVGLTRARIGLNP
ncbi:hypothetical protein MLD38_027039 [Melastoma candidum]|uniref:Uncharacterized protein n=1 Tax=Melastoma candidum TaxID=119954 RepID=A0ACB9P590_9MYRT|nr:hypothetical protein MLD38_027039 [Melastoma candidum]